MPYVAATPTPNAGRPARTALHCRYALYSRPAKQPKGSPFTSKALALPLHATFVVPTCTKAHAAFAKSGWCGQPLANHVQPPTATTCANVPPSSHGLPQRRQHAANCTSPCAHINGGSARTRVPSPAGRSIGSLPHRAMTQTAKTQRPQRCQGPLQQDRKRMSAFLLATPASTHQKAPCNK